MITISLYIEKIKTKIGKQKVNKIILITSGVMLLSSITAVSAKGALNSFEYFDIDSSGSITKKEFQSFSQTKDTKNRFKQIDLNSDLVITPDEFAKEPATNWGYEMDPDNSDGRTEEED